MVVVASVLALASVHAEAQDCPLSAPFVDPLRFASLPLESVQACEVEKGRWLVSYSTGYFNVWQRSWHTGTLHRELGRRGKPLEPWELRTLEQRHPSQQLFHIDLEGWRSDVAIAHGFGAGLVATVLVPVVGVGRPHWDALPESFHRAFGLAEVRRDVFPRGGTVVYVRGHSGAIERWDEEARSGFGDISVALGGKAGSWLGIDHRWVIALEAPTGEAGSLRGSGGWDAGARWFATWTGARSLARIGLGYTFLDRDGSWLGARRDDTWHALVEGRRTLGDRLFLRGMARFDSSPLASFTRSDIGQFSFFWTVGAGARLGEATDVAIDLGENYPSSAEVPDFSFHLSLIRRF